MSDLDSPSCCPICGRKGCFEDWQAYQRPPSGCLAFAFIWCLGILAICAFAVVVWNGASQ